MRPAEPRSQEYISTPERERLGMLIDVIGAAAKRRLGLPRNVEKGDEWRGLEYPYFVFRMGEEMGEMERVRADWIRSGLSAEEMTAEAGDVMNFVAMYLDKYLSEVREREDSGRKQRGSDD